ncbi:PREDICTED: protein KTI12 homolog isoform X2 [Cyphomyrmex costatus]|uniref:Protein KTI12 homolog n=1 Tax=Cyphomyrmex costatus TaxID=456900 RepID=A0A151IG49_9HYME|nr:PREDICTED: protein KTI12 homolog isoform X2 [Cyphomyrmex costatus]KYN00196.1 Protein KTI12 like protein [Cyphomyrmex costatus]
MPLIIVTGIPCSGKTMRSLELKNYFEEKLKDSTQNVEIISESNTIIQTGYNKNTYFADSKKEKAIRSSIKSDIQRKLDSNNLLIFDGSNYIKGYRYEIYCTTKLYKTPQCTLHCNLPIDQAWLWNSKRVESDRYNREIFDSLVSRYEVPETTNRWDCPLFTIMPEDTLMCDEIYCYLYKGKLPKPNLSTQNPPLASTNYLHELDNITKDVINVILSMQQLGINNDIKIPDSSVNLERATAPSKLAMLRRQFITFSKMQQNEVNNIATLFVQYLNNNIR